MIKLTLSVIMFFIFAGILTASDPLDEIDGTESWYEGTLEGKGDIVYYNEAYEKDMKTYLAYLKAKQKGKTDNKNISNKLNKRKKSKADDDDIGEIGSLEDESKLKDDLMKSDGKTENNDKDNQNNQKNDDDLLDDDLD